MQKKCELRSSRLDASVYTQRREVPKEKQTTQDLDPAGLSEEIYENFCVRRICDGFPVIPPTEERVLKMLRFTDLDADDVLIDNCIPSGARLTVEKLAINAVMAGCRPEYFPILVTAFRAMAEPAYAFESGAITAHPSGNLILASGPIADEIGIHSGAGCLGPGFRANATIGRAIALCQITVCRAIPGISDCSVLGSPAEYSYCFAENRRENPWNSLHEELGYEKSTTVTAFKCEGPHNLVCHLGASADFILKEVAWIGSAIGGNNAWWPTDLLVVLCPYHAKIIHKEGWSKKDVKAFIYEHARNPMELLTGRGTRPRWPKWFEHSFQQRVPVVEDASHIYIAVAGGPGWQSQVCRPWTFSRLITKPVTDKDGRPVNSISELRQA